MTHPDEKTKRLLNAIDAYAAASSEGDRRMRLPPGPYTMGYSGPENAKGWRYMVIYDAKARVILSVFGKQEEREALAQLIINASKDKL
jgi:hypothetical protein